MTRPAAGAGSGAAAGDQPLRLAEGREPEIVRILLPPFEAALGAVDAELQAVLVAGRDLARPEHALGAALEAQQDMDVVVERRPLTKVREIGARARRASGR